MCAHQVVLGEIADFITGETMADTLDERARQEIARFLVEQKDYRKDEIELRRSITLDVDGKRDIYRLDFVIRVANKAFMIIMFGPGSVVSRHRPALAAARLVEDYAIPLAVVTNGKTADVLETRSGQVIGEGLNEIPSRDEALRRLDTAQFERIPEERLAKERRILYAFEVLAKCECEDASCSLR
jgi:hypothetical protein